MPHSRRRFLGRTAGAVVGTMALPPGVRAASSRWSERSLTGLDDLSRALRFWTQQDEAYWRLVRDQFPVREDLVLMNAANLCPSPRTVQERVFELTRDVDADASFQNRSKFGALAQASREALARLMDAGADEIAIVRNTSSANATVVNALDLGPGDEVVLWDQNHPTNNLAWDVRAQRLGFTLRRVSTSPTPAGAQELLAPFADAITGSTRVVSFSHVSNVSGVALPARELCALAHERGAFAMVDGAQTFGALRVDLSEMGCDAYTGSAHKWFVGPKEAGLLFVRRDRHSEMWPTQVGVGWAGAIENGARKFEVLGQRDDAAVAAVATTVEFHELIGLEEVEARVRELVSALRTRLTERVPGVHFHTPADPALSAGVVVFALPSVQSHREAFGRLYEDFGVAGASAGGGFNGIRLCPHIYNTLAQVERVVDALAALS